MKSSVSQEEVLARARKKKTQRARAEASSTRTERDWRRMIRRDSLNPIMHLAQHAVLEEIIKTKGKRSIMEAVMDKYKASFGDEFTRFDPDFDS